MRIRIHTSLRAAIGLRQSDIFIDVVDQPSDELKRIIGGGRIAEVKTVQETLK